MDLNLAELDFDLFHLLGFLLQEFSVSKDLAFHDFGQHTLLQVVANFSGATEFGQQVFIDKVETIFDFSDCVLA